MAHWPVKKSRAVLTGLWKLCARMPNRRVNDDLSDALSDAADAWLSTKTVSHECVSGSVHQTYTLWYTVRHTRYVIST
jgi:hypothetical protein